MSHTDPFTIESSYKGNALVTDNLQSFKGYFDKGTSNGSLWIGATMKPLKKFEDNFQVVSTDYDNYAILYTCTFKTAMYDHDSITVLTRNSPSIEEIPEDVMDKIKSEFNRIFGGVEPTEE